MTDLESKNQLEALEKNANEYGISYWGLGHKKNGIVHVVGPEYGITQPGATMFVEIHILPLMELLVQLHLELEHPK